MNFLYRTPFFRLFAALVIGIITYNYIQWSLIHIIGIASLSMGLLAVSFLFKNPIQNYQFRWLFGAGSILLLFALGQYLSFRVEKNATFHPIDQNTSYLVKLASPTIEKPKSYRAEVELKQYLKLGKWQKATGTAVVYFEKSESVKRLLIGDKILMRTTFKKPTGAENPNGFDYAAYLNKKGINATAYIQTTNWKKLPTEPVLSIQRHANILRTRLIDIFRTYHIEGQEFAVLSALTLGYIDELSPETMGSYSASGAMHILSVSGLHVGIVYVVMAFLLSFLKKGGLQIWTKTIFIVLFLWTYAYISGLSPSVVRSAVMFSFVAAGTALNRKSHIFNTIFMSAFFMLLYNPNYLYDIGFQLSYSAVLSIVLFQKPLSDLLPTSSKPLKWLRDLFAVSLAAQIGTMPFTFYYFQQFPNYFILTNLVAIPLSTLIIYGAMLLLSISWFTLLGNYVAMGLNFLLLVLNESITGIVNLPFSVSIIPFNFLQSILLIAVITLLFFYVLSRKTPLLFSALIAIILLIIPSLLSVYTSKNSERIVVFSDNKHTHINLIYGTLNKAYTTDSVQFKKVASKYWISNFIDQPHYFELTQANTKAVYAAGKRIVVANEKHWKYKTQGSKLKTDILIIGNNLKPRFNALIENIDPKLVIVDKTISTWYSNHVKEGCKMHRIAFHSLAENGAFSFEKSLAPPIFD